MNFYLIVGLLFLVIIAFKIFDSVVRNKLSQFEKIKLGVSISLLVLFVVTSNILPYPQSLYWFIFLSILLISSLLTSRLIRLELKRQLALNKKDRVINILYYSSIVTSLFYIF